MGQVDDMGREANREIPAGNGETILVVEDDTAIRELYTEMLESLGYALLDTGMPNEALQLSKFHGGHIALLLTDVVMPEMNGLELAEKLKQCCPKIRILFMSGYPVFESVKSSVLNGGVNFIQKPFSVSDLAEKIRAVLDEQ